MNRNFKTWLAQFRQSIATYEYYVNFPKVYLNVEKIKIELNILNTLIGCKDIESKFVDIITRYPETLKCIPILLAVRDKEIAVTNEEGFFVYKFDSQSVSKENYVSFMSKSGLFDLLQNHLINNLVDYVTGVETGLDSNGRKNRGGHLMEKVVENFLRKANAVKKDDTAFVSYFPEMYISEIEKKWKLDMSAISNNGKTEKRFDFVVKTENMIYGVETNFYASGGSKLNETARSYKTLALESRNISGFTFVWFTDGRGWFSAEHNLEETFSIMSHLYNINDMENGIMETVFK